MGKAVSASAAAGAFGAVAAAAAAAAKEEEHTVSRSEFEMSEVIERRHCVVASTPSGGREESSGDSGGGAGSRGGSSRGARAMMLLKVRRAIFTYLLSRLNSTFLLFFTEDHCHFVPRLPLFQEKEAWKWELRKGGRRTRWQRRRHRKWKSHPGCRVFGREETPPDFERASSLRLNGGFSQRRREAFFHWLGMQQRRKRSQLALHRSVFCPPTAAATATPAATDAPCGRKGR